MKKLAIFIAAALCSFSAFAVNGPYIGAGIGYSSTIFNRYETITTISSGHVSWTDINAPAKGFQGQVVAGYAYDINKFRLGGELIAQGPKTRYTEDSSDNGHDNFSFDYAYGINLVPGYYITDSNLLYLKLGVMRGEFELKDIDALDTGLSDVINTSYHSTGINLGLGTEMYLTKNIGLKLEYLYTRYAEKKLTSDIPAGYTTVSKIRPETYTFMLGLDYQFNLF